MNVIGGSIGILVLMVLSDNEYPVMQPIASLSRAVEAVIPVMVGILAAFAFAPDDEPPIETLMACPRPLWWVLAERLAMLAGAMGLVGAAGTGLSLILAGGGSIPISAARWLAPMVFLAGVACFVTHRSGNSTFSVVVVVIVWAVSTFGGPALLPDQPGWGPLARIQPYLWIVHPFLQPTDMTLGDFWVNRGALVTCGAALIGLTMRGLADSERVLLGVEKARQRGKGVE